MNPYAKKMELSSIYGVNYSVWFQEGILWFGSVNMYGSIRFKLKVGAISRWLTMAETDQLIKNMHHAYPYDYGRITLYDYQLKQFRKELFTAWMNTLPQIRKEDDTDQMRIHIDRVERKLKEALERYNEEND